MATSGTYTETRTAAQLIKDAHLDVGVGDAAQDLDSNLVTVAIRKLNDIIYQWCGPPNPILRSLKMWQRERQEITLDSTKNSYSLKPSGGDEDIQVPEEIESVVLRHTSSSTDSVLEEMSLTEYEALSAKSAAGTPLKWYYERRISEGKIYLNCKPSTSVASAYTIQIVYRQPMENIAAGTNEIDCPKYAYRALRYQLAMDLSPSFNVKSQRYGEIKGLRNEAVMIMNSFEPEDVNVHFEPGRDD